MSEQFGDNDHGTVGSSVAPQTESAPQETTYQEPIGGDQVQAEQSPAGEVQETPQDVDGLLKTVESLRAEVQRKEQYAQFLKEYINNEPQHHPQQQQQQREQFDMDDDVIPYVGDVRKLMEVEINKRIEARVAEMQEQAVLNDMRTLGNQKRAADPNFDRRMDYAIELLRDPAYAAAYNRVPNDASQKIAFLEKIAPFHPNHTAPAPNLTQEAINKIQANAAMPQTLASVGGAGRTQKSIRDMTDEEFTAYRERQRREM